MQEMADSTPKEPTNGHHHGFDRSHTPAGEGASSTRPSSPHLGQRDLSPEVLETASEPISRSSSPVPFKSPKKDPYARHIQQRIDEYSVYSNRSSLQTDDEARIYNDGSSTPTQSTAPPSECDSQDLERSNPNSLKPPVPRPKRKASKRAAGERDDGGCNLPCPPPPLCRTFSSFSCILDLSFRSVRPTTFWKNTPRSALASPAYSPSTHLIRQSTFVAAGIDNSEPLGDFGALCVETRTPTHTLVLPPETI